MGLSTFVQREDNSGKQCHWDRDSMIILLSAVSLTKENLMLLLQTWLIDWSGCDATSFPQLEMGTKRFATPCDVRGALGLRRVKSSEVSGWCEVFPPSIVMFVVAWRLSTLDCNVCRFNRVKYQQYVIIYRIKCKFVSNNSFQWPLLCWSVNISGLIW